MVVVSIQVCISTIVLMDSGCAPGVGVGSGGDGAGGDKGFGKDSHVIQHNSTHAHSFIPE